MYFSIYPTIAKDADSFIKMLENYPEYLQSAMGLHLESITSLLGFYAFILTFVILCAGIQSLHIGISIISKEERDRTVDFLMTKPISRSSILTEKILAGLTTLVITNVFFFMIAKIMVEVFKTNDYDNRLFALMTITIFLVQLMFYVLGILLSVIMPKVKSVLPISLGVVFAFFIFGTLVVSDEKDIYRYLTPFKYFEPNDILLKGGFGLLYILVAFIFITASIVASYVVYNKKNIHAV
jgi:ABC-2 type transport system permease protein